MPTAEVPYFKMLTPKLLQRYTNRKNGIRTTLNNTVRVRFLAYRREKRSTLIMAVNKPRFINVFELIKEHPKLKIPLETLLKFYQTVKTPEYLLNFYPNYI